MLLIISIPLYFSFNNSVEQSLIQEAKNTSNVIAELRSLYTTEVVNQTNRGCAPAMSIYSAVQGAIPLPATLSIMLGERLSKGKYEGQVKLYSKYPFPWREKTGGLRDNFGKNAWEFLYKNPDSSYYEVQEIEGQEVIRYATGDVLKQACVKCHNSYIGTPKTDWKVNDLRGILEIQKPTKSILARTQTNFIYSGSIIFLFSLLLIFILHKILTHLKKSIIVHEHVNSELSDLKEAFDETAIIAVADLQGNITSVNKKFCEISKYKEEELIGQNHRIINSGFHDKSFFVDLWKTISSGNVWVGNIKNKAKDGSHYWVNTTIIPLKNPSGKITQFISIRFEITQQKLGEEKILQHNKDLENFAHIISHDLKAPLRGIQTLAKFIEEDMGEDLPKDVANHIRLLNGRTQRMDNLITGVLNFSKHSMDSVDIDTEEVNVNELVEQIIQDAHISEHIQIETANNLPSIQCNPVKAHQIFGNLIWNAIKYNDNPSPKIEIGFNTLQNGKVNFFVKDNGPGIAKEYQEKVFIIFQTLNARDQVESTGVGLSIVKKMLNNMGGEIWIESDGKTGTTFYFNF